MSTLLALRRSRWLLAIALGIAIAAILGVVLVVREDSNGSQVTPDGPTRQQLTTAHEGLCQARNLAAQGDLPGASRAFLDRAHLPLHVLAAAVQPRDTAAAGTLLETMFRVETVLFATTVVPGSDVTPVPQAAPAETAANVDQLRQTMEAAALVLGVKLAAC
ncbi:MAG TPA: hypothetical protein VFB90_06075 [Dehalococcoidia bacterium]|nr:hypothetical protein [Dehalococcoidia bacterium]